MPAKREIKKNKQNFCHRDFCKQAMWITRQKAERIVQKYIIIILAGYKSNLPFNTDKNKQKLTNQTNDAMLTDRTCKNRTWMISD